MIVEMEEEVKVLETKLADIKDKLDSSEVDETASFETTTSDSPIDDKPADKPDDKSDKPDDKTEPADKTEPKDKTAQADKSDDKTDDKSEPGDKPADKPEGRPKGNRAQKRIDRLTARAKTAETRAELAEAKLLEKSNKSKEVKEKQPDEFENYDDYISHLAEVKQANDDIADKAKKEVIKPIDQPAEPDGYEEAFNDVNAAFEESKANYKDFDTVITNDELRITPTMVIALAETDDPTDITYYLATHSDEAARIADLSPLQQMRSIAKLENKSNRVQTVAPKTTKTPDPIDDIVSGIVSVENDLKDKSFSDYEKIRNEQEKGKRDIWSI